MAKYDVVYACGHEDRVELIGSHKSRNERLEGMEESDCPSCVEKTHQQTNAQSAAAAKAAGWPALTGTVRQVAWAETLRANAIAELRGTANQWRHAYPDATVDLVEIIVTRALAVPSASWWIETRNHVVINTVRLAGAEVAQALDRWEPLEKAGLGPHTIARAVIDLPPKEPHWPRDTVRTARCSCGWQPDATEDAMLQAREHIQELSEEERAAVERAHPKGEPHACTEALGLRRCLMRPFLS
ncbi:hypothetical protein ABZ864_40330 [Streptomyces sp. NPDC047082]|uniref:hypothetical protein n=1 Tax=Streptomyces sp. NPDC047082 TaxID=3155259 RepID=UPI0033F13A24